MEISKFQSLGDKIRTMLEDHGYLSENNDYEPNPIDGNISISYAYPIKAFEKFLGYYDVENRVAYNPSISMRTDFSYCIAACRYNKNGNEDTVILDGVTDEKYLRKAKFALDYFRKEFRIKGSFDFYIRRYRRYTKAKGLSESSAVAAAVSRALIKNVFGEGPALDDVFVSKYARLVSGSGTRAAHSGISIWLSYPGINLRECAAFRVADDPHDVYYGIFPKYTDIATDSAHSVAVKSIFYASWLEDKYANIKRLIEHNFDIDELLISGENDMLKLNAILFSGGLIIQTGESLRILRAIQDFKKNGDLFFTADTGPSIMVLSRDKSLIEELRQSVEDPYIEGTYNFNRHTRDLNNFTKEANEYFLENKIE
ncbi:mevalonate 3,5-bisphosphate decarboxylase [Thermoplasma volcanium]|nr:mevalonate 3,5-bisphosphate decarboxylase [Thermoplasma volcanium]